MMQFTKAVKKDAKGRIALVGPAGSGKSYTMLTLARTLAGPDGKIAAVDTEHGSLSKYADMFDFDGIDLDSYSLDNFLAALSAAEKGGYAVFCCDSLSHFWMGKDGALEFVDLQSQRSKDKMGGWKEFSPHERAMVDRMIASPCHVIVTMRTKTEYAEQIDENGKKKRVKIGLAPVQRAGLEYEFDLVGYMDDANHFITDKTRFPGYADKVIKKPSAKDFAPFVEWLKGAKADPPKTTPQQQAPQTPQAPAAPWDWHSVEAAFAELRAKSGDELYYKVLGAHGIAELCFLSDRNSAMEIYRALRDATPADVPKTDAPKNDKPRGGKNKLLPSDTQIGEPLLKTPEPVQAMWKDMRDIPSCIKVFGGLKADFVEVLGTEIGESSYYELLAKSGVEKSNQFRSLDAARKCAESMWMRLNSLAAEPVQLEVV